MDKSMLKNMFSSERISISDNSCYVSEQKKAQICDALERLNFSSQIITFIKEFAGVSIGIKIDKQLFQYFHVISLLFILQLPLVGRVHLIFNYTKIEYFTLFPF